MEYTPYGESWIEEGTELELNKIKWKFTSKELDSETGLYYFGARYLDPQASRFMSVDPIFDGLMEGISPYSYCRNNPIAYYDPDGCKPNPYLGMNLSDVNPSTLPSGMYLVGRLNEVFYNNAEVRDTKRALNGSSFRENPSSWDPRVPWLMHQFLLIVKPDGTWETYSFFPTNGDFFKWQQGSVEENLEGHDVEKGKKGLFKKYKPYIVDMFLTDDNDRFKEFQKLVDSEKTIKKYNKKTGKRYNEYHGPFYHGSLFNCWAWAQKRLWQYRINKQEKIKQNIPPLTLKR